MRASPGVRDTALAPQRRCLPGRYPLNKGEQEVQWSHHRSWSDKSNWDQPRQKNYSHLSLILLHRPPYDCESSVSDVTSASMARHGFRASCSRLAERCLVSFVFSIQLFILLIKNDSPLFLPVYKICFQSFDIGPLKWLMRPNFIMAKGVISLGDSLA